MTHLILLIIILFSSSHLIADPSSWSVEAQRMSDFIYKCAQPPSVEFMENEILNSIGNINPHDKKHDSIQYKLTRNFKKILDIHSNIESINIDGFIIKKIPAKELAILLRLTANADAYSKAANNHKTVTEIKNKTLFIHRTCHAESCELNVEDNKGYLNKVKNNDGHCQTLICAAKKIFGDPKGTYLTFALNRYGLQMSKYAQPNADPTGFKINHIESILSAVQSVPEHLLDSTINNTTFYKYLSEKLHLGHTGVVIALVDGSIFDTFNSVENARKTFIIAHEIGHRASMQGDRDLAYESEWLAASGFNEATIDQNEPKSFELQSKRTTISSYGNKNPHEDFAETYAMYRYYSKRLLKISPKRYIFMRDSVFNGIEYLKTPCQGKKPKQTQTSPKTENQ